MKSKMAAEYKKVSLIGSGTFGKVWLVRHLPTGRRCVIKEVAVSSLSDKDKKQALTEVEVLSKCRHVNVIRYRGAFIQDSLLNIVMSHADGGDLHMRIQKQRGVHFPEPVILDWFVQIVFALRYIHGLHIVHRDLKTQNIFLAGDNQVKVGDFGIARVLSNTDDHAMTAVGTPYYLSPEICQQQPYNYKSDMWSLGCVLYELCCLTHPFDGQNIAALVIKILNGTYAPIPRHYSALLEDLISVLLRGEADARPSADQILWVPALQQYVQGHVTKSSAMTPSRSAVTPSCTKQTPVAMTPCSSQQTPSPGMIGGWKMDRSIEAEKENIMPTTGVKRSRCMSQSTPKTEVMAANIRISNSAECTRESVLARRKTVSKNRPSPTLSLYKQVLRHAHKNSPERDLNIDEGSPKKSSPVRKICSKTYTVRKGSNTGVENRKGLNIAPENQSVGEGGGSPRRKHAIRERKDNHNWSRPIHPAPGRMRRMNPGSKHDRRPHTDMQVGRIQHYENSSHVEAQEDMGKPCVKISQPQGPSVNKCSQPHEQSAVKFSQPHEQSAVKFSQPPEPSDDNTSQRQGQSEVQSHVKFSKPQIQSDMKFSQPQRQSDVEFSQQQDPNSSPRNKISQPEVEHLANSTSKHTVREQIPHPPTPRPDTNDNHPTPIHKDSGIYEPLGVNELLYTTYSPTQQDAYPHMEKLRSDLENDLGVQRLYDLQRVVERSQEEKMTFTQLREQLGSEVEAILPRLLVLMQLEAIVSM